MTTLCRIIVERFRVIIVKNFCTNQIAKLCKIIEQINGIISTRYFGFFLDYEKRYIGFVYNGTFYIGFVRFETFNSICKEDL